MRERHYDKMKTRKMVFRLLLACFWIALAGTVVGLSGTLAGFAAIQATGVFVVLVGITTWGLILFSSIALNLPTLFGWVRNSNPAGVEIISPDYFEPAARERDLRNFRRTAFRIACVALPFNLALVALSFSPFASTWVGLLLIGVAAGVAILAVMWILTLPTVST